LEQQIHLAKEVIKEDLPKLKKYGLNLEPLKKHLDNLKKNLYICSNAKSGDLSQYRAINWGSGYRILFQIDENNKKITVAAIDKHDDAYKKTKKRNK